MNEIVIGCVTRAMIQKSTWRPTESIDRYSELKRCVAMVSKYNNKKQVTLILTIDSNERKIGLP
jgi:hypothetical protein